LQDSFNHERLRPADPENLDSFKVRRGKVGGFVDYFSDEDIAYIDDYIDRNLDPYFACYYSKNAQDAVLTNADSDNRVPTAIAVPEVAANDNSGRNRWARVAAIAALFAAGWLANDFAADFSSPAAAASVIDEAQEAYVASLARRQMASQIETVDFDRGEILEVTGIEVPALPVGWTVTDAQVYPSDLGNSVMMSLTTTSGEEVSLFAAEEEASLSEIPAMDVNDGVAVAYWEEGPMVVALIGELDAPKLLALAADLADDS
ncbi:MAG: hypothetical protein WA957_01445, partial [Alteraurantiacibacter sp.]